MLPGIMTSSVTACNMTLCPAFELIGWQNQPTLWHSRCMCTCIWVGGGGMGVNSWNEELDSVPMRQIRFSGEIRVLTDDNNKPIDAASGDSGLITGAMIRIGQFS